ncbi:MAG: Hsp20/alpha crystallin family protein [Alphaproteobacteria bacterium]|nr:MAG: Hsp20/alpha crystallin family protein [Alphaproteobacteria bacterium]
MLLSSWERAGWDPFAEMRRLQSAMNQLFDGTVANQPAQVDPPVNLWLGDASVAVTAELPGLSNDDIELTIAEDSLTIRGERKDAAQGEDVAWHRRERPSGAFSRTVALPFRVDPDKVQARFVDGVLEVEMQRPQADLPRKIDVKTH